MVNEQERFGDDLPKKNPWRDDRLGIAPYADRIAKVIQKCRAPNGYVIGLHGAWGSGKSTVLNFVAAYLTKFNETVGKSDQITIIDFRPWIVSGHQDLIGAFFKLLTESLGPREVWWRRRWRSVIRIFGYGSDKLIDTAAVLAMAALPPFGMASGAVGAVTKRSLNRMIDSFLKDPSLQVAHRRLVEQLKDSSRRFLVIIDDLDRIEDGEIKEIMRMVKTIGHLPNVVYLLAYDKEIVWRAVDDGVSRYGPRFAEKIVQQELELPKPSRAALLSILSDHTGFIPPAPEGSMRSYYIVQYGIHRWIKSPRDVERLGNAIGFAWPALEGEVDPHDLLAMEGLKLFDSAAFNWIRDNRDLLFGRGIYRMAQDEERKDTVAKLSALLQESDRSQVLRIVAALFPQIGKLMGDRYSYGGEPHVEVRKRRGIGSEAGYDSYFSLDPSRNAVPKADVDRAVARVNDTESLERAIRAYLVKTNDQGEPMVGDFLDELRLRFLGRSPIDPTQGILDALFRVGDEIVALDWDGRELELPPRAKIWFLIEGMLELWGEQAAGAHLLDAFRSTDSTSFRADIYVACGRAIGVFDTDVRHGTLISDSDFKLLGQLLLPAIRRDAQEGTLEHAPYYYDIVRAWAYLDGPDKARSWMSSGLMRSSEFMAKTGRGLLAHTVSGRVRKYYMEDAPNSAIYDLKIIVAAGRKHLADTTMDEDARNVISEMTKGAEKFLSQSAALGKPSSNAAS